MGTLIILSLLLASCGFVVCVYLLYQVLKGKRKMEGRKETHLPLVQNRQEKPKTQTGQKQSVYQKILGASKTLLSDYVVLHPEEEEESEETPSVPLTEENMNDLGIGEDDLRDPEEENLPAESPNDVTGKDMAKIAEIALKDNTTPEEELIGKSLLRKLQNTVFLQDLAEVVNEKQIAIVQKLKATEGEAPTDVTMDNNIAKMLSKSVSLG